MNGLVRFLPIEAPTPWVVMCGKCEHVLRSGKHAIFVSENDKVVGVIADDTIKHCDTDQFGPYLFRDFEGVVIFTDIFTSGVNAAVLKRLRIVGADTLGPAALAEANVALQEKIKQGSQLDTSKKK